MGVKVPDLALDVSRFAAPYAGFNGHLSIPASKRKALKFATSVGTASYKPAFGQTATALALAAYRAQAVRCVIDFGQPVLRKYIAYRELDSSEKASLSYWIGMTVAAIAADEVLNVPRLTHGSKLQIYAPSNPLSKSLADLAGPDLIGDWHVIEAKGRQQNASAAARSKYKTQAQTIASINGTPVATTSYAIAYLKRTITGELVDPPAGDGGIDLQIDLDDFGEGYYRPYREFLGREPTKFVRNRRTFLVRPISYDPIDGEYIYVGLEDQFYSGQVRDTVQVIDDQQMYVGRDGVAIVTSHSPCTL